MQQSTIATIIFCICFGGIACIAIPLSHEVYLSASITTILQYAFVQFLIHYEVTVKMICIYYLIPIGLGLIAGIIGFFSSFDNPSLMMIWIGTVIPNAIGVGVASIIGMTPTLPFR